MREQPADLCDEALVACLYEQYGLRVKKLTFLHLGADSRAWVFRADTDRGRPYFLKVRQKINNESSLLVPHYLHEHGVARVMAPLPNTAQSLWTAMGSYALILYPFIDGHTGKIGGMTSQQWITYGKTLGQIHGTSLAADLERLMTQETFVPIGVSMVHDLQALINEGNFDDPAANSLAAFWQQRQETIQNLAKRGEELAQRLAQNAPPLVLCHADIHTNNVMVDTDGQIWIVDWDDVVLAPKERDLMFVLGGGIGLGLVRPMDEELFLQGYGPANADPLGLAYYRYAWALSDVGEYGSQVLSRPDLGALTRQSAFESFQILFKPGNIVSIALSSDQIS